MIPTILLYLKMIYWGIFKNGKLISNAEFEVVANIPHVEYILQDKGNNYKLLKPDATTNFLKIGGFQLQDISSTFMQGKKSMLRLTFLELRTDDIFQVDIEEHGITFVKQELLPLMQKLNELGSFAAYDQSLKLEKLKEENLKLIDKIKILESKN